MPPFQCNKGRGQLKESGACEGARGPEREKGNSGKVKGRSLGVDKTSGAIQRLFRMVGKEEREFHPDPVAQSELCRVGPPLK